MPATTSCGVVLLNTRHELFVCHVTGTARWDLPKGLGEVGESPRETAVRETWEETSLALDAAALHDLGGFDYLPAKRLHLFALRLEPDAFELSACRCHSTFPHRVTGRPTPEADGYAWKSVSTLPAWCGKNLSRVLASLDWAQLARLPVVARVATRP